MRQRNTPYIRALAILTAFAALQALAFNAHGAKREVTVPPPVETLTLPKVTIDLPADKADVVGKTSLRPTGKFGPVVVTYYADAGLRWTLKDVPRGIYRLAIVTNTGGSPLAPYNRLGNLTVRIAGPEEVVPDARTVDTPGFTPYDGYPPQPISYWANKRLANMTGAARIKGLYRLGPNATVQITARNDRPPVSLYRLLLDPVETPAEQIAIALKGTAEANLYCRGVPPVVELTVRNFSTAGATGRVRGRLVDLAGLPVPALEDLRVTVDAWSAKTMTVRLPELAGAFKYRPQFIPDGGKGFPAGELGYSWSPAPTADKLPLDWPLAHHRFYGKENNRVYPGTKWLRVFWSWAKIEKQKGTFDWTEMDRRAEIARRYRTKLLYVAQLVPAWAVKPPAKPKMFHGIGAANAPSDMADLAHFIEKLMTRYRDVIGAIEVWNEGNVTGWSEWTPEEYVRMAKTIRETARKVNPEVRIVGITVSAGIHADYMESLMKAGALPHLDLCSVHCYEEMSSPRMAPGSTQRGQVVRAQRMMEKYSRPLPVWDTESGLRAYGRVGGLPVGQSHINREYKKLGIDPEHLWIAGGRWRRTSELRAALMLQRGVVQMLAEGCGKIFFFYSWTLANGESRLHVPASGVIASLLEGAANHVETVVDGDAERKKGNPEIYVYRWKRGAETVYAAWRHEQTPDTMSNPMLWIEPLAPKRCAIDLGATGGTVTAKDMFLRREIPVKRNGTKAIVPLTEQPVYLFVRP